MKAAGIPFVSGAASAGAPALRDDACDRWITYGELVHRAERWRDGLGVSERRPLLFLFAPNEVEAVPAMLGGLAAGRAVALLNPALPAEAVNALVAAYAPDEIALPATGGVAGYLRDAVGTGFTLLRRATPASPEPHPDLAVLLSTSGSTGSPKFVRLRLESLVHNAGAIADALRIRPDDVGCGHLEIHYSYGLSILTSHLVRGARVLLTKRSFMDRQFWDGAREGRVTHLPGVPFHYQMLRRLGFARMDLPALRTMTQAGGRLDLAIQEEAHAYMAGRGGQFYVMYGQTEAAPRIATLAHEDFDARKGSVGRALKGGRIEVAGADGEPLPPGEEGEIRYRGPNVMLGYAENRADLAKGDELNGVLLTGDLGRLDADGFLSITGRTKRLGKVFGWRVNLDEIERAAATETGVAAAATQRDDAIVIWFESNAHIDRDALLDTLTRHFALPRRTYAIMGVPAFPRTANGKIDYRELGAST